MNVDYKQKVTARESLSDWLSNFEWSIWFTGTFREDLNVKDPFKCKRYFNRYLSRIEKKGRGLDYFMAIEQFHHSDFMHVHALINKVENVNLHELWKMWFERYGRAVVEVYDKKQGANHYITKYVVKGFYDWDLRIKKEENYKLI